MGIKLLVLLLVIYGCGKQQVKLVPNKLESADLLTDKDATRFQKNGTFDSRNQTILYNEKSYKISKYSSQSSFDFIKSGPVNSQISIVFTGGIKGDEVVLENIKKR